MLKEIFFRVGLAAVTTLALVGCGGGAPAPKTDETKNTQPSESKSPFVISAIPDEKITEQKAKFDKLASYLTETLGVPTEFQFSKDYTDSVVKFKNGEIHMVWYGGLTGAQARRAVPGAEAIAQGIEDPMYKSYFIANKNSGLEPSEAFPAAIKEKKFTFGSPSSTSGRLMPAFFIMENNGGIQPEAWFTTEPGFQISGGHVATANAVADGTYDVGALNYGTYDSLVQSDPKVRDNTQIIWVTPPYADYNFTIHPDTKELFGEDFFEKVQQALIAAPVGSDALKAINRQQIIAAKSSDFDGIQSTAEKLGLFE